MYVEKTRVGATNWSHVKRAGIEWGRSGRLHVVFVKRCPSRYYYVKVYETRSARNLAGWATLNYDPKINIAWYGSLHLNTRSLTSSATRRKTACHELGHAFGLQAPPERPDLHARRLHHPLRPPRRHRLRQPAPHLRPPLTPGPTVP